MQSNWQKNSRLLSLFLLILGIIFTLSFLGGLKTSLLITGCVLLVSSAALLIKQDKGMLPKIIPVLAGVPLFAVSIMILGFIYGMHDHLFKVFDSTHVYLVLSAIATLQIPFAIFLYAKNKSIKVCIYYCAVISSPVWLFPVSLGVYNLLNGFRL